MIADLESFEIVTKARLRMGVRFGISAECAEMPMMVRCIWENTPGKRRTVLHRGKGAGVVTWGRVSLGVRPNTQHMRDYKVGNAVLLTECAVLGSNWRGNFAWKQGR